MVPRFMHVTSTTMHGDPKDIYIKFLVARHDTFRF